MNTAHIHGEDLYFDDMLDFPVDKYYNAADIVYQTDQKGIEEEIREFKRMVLDYLNRL
jgi:hypothetical protein